MEKNKYLIIFLKFMGWWFAIVIVFMWLSVIFTIF